MSVFVNKDPDMGVDSESVFAIQTFILVAVIAQQKTYQICFSFFSHRFLNLQNS